MSLHLFPIITPHIQTLGGLVLNNIVDTGSGLCVGAMDAILAFYWL